MIVKILSSAATFNGVTYNTNKVETGKGELMKVSGFGALSGLSNLRPKDYINYFKLLAARNPQVRSPQFHAVISAKERQFDKLALTGIAENWLKEMGFGDQPYMIIFHRDTANNHVHVVSVRVDKNGKRISNSFENLRSIRSLNKVLGLDTTNKAEKDVSDALAYRFTTIAQFKLILEVQGYILEDKAAQIGLVKFGECLYTFDKAAIEHNKYRGEKDKERLKQLSAIFQKYKAIHDVRLVPNTIPLPGGLQKIAPGFTSPFAAFLEEKFALALYFHAKDGQDPYGYTVIDHSTKQVFKGGEIMPLGELLDNALQPSVSRNVVPDEPALQEEASVTAHSQPIAGSLTQNDIPITAEAGDIHISIADDIDDEAILGRNRRRSRQARTNTR